MRERARSGGADVGAGTERGQLSLSAVEATIGVLFVLAAASTFAIAIPTAGAQSAQLDSYAGDTVAVLAREPPRHAGATRLSEVSQSPSTFDRERAALERRVARILPENLLFRVVTPHGAVGFRRPTNAPMGSASVTTLNGRVTVWVWYA